MCALAGRRSASWQLYGHSPTIVVQPSSSGCAVVNRTQDMAGGECVRGTHRIGPDVGLGFSAPIAMWYVFIGKRVEDSKGLVGEPRRRRQVWPVRKVATHEIHDRRRAAIGRALPSHRCHPPGLARWRREVAMPSRMPVDLPPPPRHLGDAVRSSRIWLKWRCTRS